MTDIITYLRRPDIQESLKKNPEIIEQVIQLQGTPPRNTLGGKVFWRTVKVGKWIFQKHKAYDFCRILNDSGHTIANGNEAAFYRRFRYQRNEFAQRKNITDKTFGIVFSGGGGNGAYEIGVYKYLYEHGLDQRITGISGTSVGALNGLLFMQGDYKQAEHLWSSVQQKDMLTPNVQKALTALDVVVGPLTTLPVKLQSLLTTQGGVFTQNGIEALIEKNVSWHMIEQARQLFFCTLLNTKRGCEYRCLTGLEKRDIVESVLQSASLPIIYGSRQDVTGRYYDGGCPIVGDNVPILPLLRHGYKDIIVIHLERDIEENRSKWQDFLLKLDTGSAKIHNVWPSHVLWDGFPNNWIGNKLAMLTINPKINIKRIQLGYEDACKQLKSLEINEHSAYIL